MILATLHIHAFMFECHKFDHRLHYNYIMQTQKLTQATFITVTL